MNRANLKLIFFFVLSVVAPRPAHSHDGWIQVNSIVEKGQPVAIALMHGNHSNEHGSFRLAGKWDTDYTKVFVIEPSGKNHDLSRSIVDLGEDPEKTGPKGPEGFHLLEFTPQDEGVDVVLARQEHALQQPAGPKLRTMRNARAAFIALSNPTVAAARKAKDFTQSHAADRVLEIIPVTNPFAITDKDPLTLQVLLNGKPAANRTVTVIGRMASAASAQDLKTDEYGRVRVAVRAVDIYLARVKFDEDSRQPSGQLNRDSYEATYVFQAFHRS